MKIGKNRIAVVIGKNGETKQEIEENILKEADVYLSPEEMINFGLADKITDKWRTKNDKV